MSRRDDDKFRSLLRMKRYFDAFPKAWARASADGVSEEFAVQTLLGALSAHARRPSLEEMAYFAMEVVRERGLLTSLAVVFAAWRWYREDPKAVALAVTAALPVVTSADLDPRKGGGVRREVFRHVHALLRDAPALPGGLDAVRIFRSLLGSNLARDENPVVAAEGRKLLEEHLAELRRATAAAERVGADAEDLRMLRTELAKAIANVGQSLQDLAERHDCDDPKARLEEALVLHNEAMTFPERVADPSEPVGLYHSLRMRGTCQRLLARHADDLERGLRLLDGAVADARAARDLCRRQPEIFPDGGLIVVNLVNAMKDRLVVHFDNGRVDKEEALRRLGEIRLIAREARSDRGEAIGPSLLAQMHVGLDRLAAHLGDERHAPDLDGLAELVIAAMETMEDREADPIDPAAARAVIQELEQLPSGDRLPGFHLNLLAGFFAGLHVDVLGPSLCVRAMNQEYRLLGLETGEPRPIIPGRADTWDPVSHVEQGISGFRARMGNPTWAHAEKRISSGWLNLLASARLSWASRGTHPIDVLEDLRLADLSGSTAWRSDLSFYGAGGTRYNNRRPMLTVEEWRLYLYRTRFERDMAAEYLHEEELQGMMGHLTGVPHPSSADGEFHRGAQIFPKGTTRAAIRAQTSVPEQLWVETADGIAVPNVVTVGTARMASTKLLGELQMAVGKMVQERWLVAEFPDVPEASPAHLRDWLASHRDTAILNVGAGLTPSITGHDGKAIWFERVQGPDEAGRLVREYEFARDEHSFGRFDVATGALDPGLSEAEREERYRRSIATPEATARLDQAMRAMLESLGNAFGPTLERAKARGVRRLVLLLRGWARHVPWFAVPVGDGLLGDTFASAVVETVAPVERAKPRRGRSVLYVGGKAGRGSSLALGKAVLAPLSDRTTGPTDRDAFEAVAASARTLRIFAHGTAMLLHTSASGIEMDEDDQRPVNRYSVSEARMLDLRGARRVELWACESGRSDALYSQLVHHDEPTGMDAAVLLAGAECAIGSLWTQYVLSSAMIAEAFTLELAARLQPEPEALAAAVRRYREGLSDAGGFTEGVLRHVARGARPVRVESALRAGLDAWRSQAWTELLGREAPPLDADLAVDGLRLGPSRIGPRTVAGDAQQLVDQILAPYRSVLAWAGWRVTLRSKEVFEPDSAGEV